MNFPVGIRSLAVSFPSVIRRNDYWRDKYPELVKQGEDKALAKAFLPVESGDSGIDIWNQEMMPYMSDPFRGAVERRVLGPDESSLTLEYRAAKDALEAANLRPEEVDLAIVSSMFPEYPEMGNAAFLAANLGLSGAAWNLHASCASAWTAFETACGLINSGRYHKVLIVVSCTYSRFTDPNDSLSFIAGDGAVAFVVSSVERNQGILGSKVINTAETCGIFFNELTIDERGNPRVFMRFNKKSASLIPHLTLKYLRNCCQGALDDANVTIDEIDFFVCYAATAWYANFCTRILGIDPERTIDLYPQYGVIAAASSVAHLYHAAQLGKIRPNDLVLVFSHGFVGDSAAVVMRWGDVALGPVPANSDKLFDTARGKVPMATAK